MITLKSLTSQTVVERTSLHAIQSDKREIAFTPLQTPESIILTKTKSPQVKDNRLQVIDKRWWNKRVRTHFSLTERKSPSRRYRQWIIVSISRAFLTVFCAHYWGSKNIQRSNNRPKKENCHDDLVPAFSFPGIASLGAGGRSSYGFCSSKKIE
jgi:hypothetical protein